MTSPAELATWLLGSLGPPVMVSIAGVGGTAVPVIRRIETRAGESLARAGSCWAPNKPAVLLNGKATWVEYVIVRLLEVQGWDARWVKNWGRGREFCLDPDRPRPPSPQAAARFSDIERAASNLNGSGAWDVFAWRGDELLFIESKQRGNDRLNSNQIGWLQAALHAGIDPACFAVVEYSLAHPSSATQ